MLQASCSGCGHGRIFFLLLGANHFITRFSELVIFLQRYFIQPPSNTPIFFPTQDTNKRFLTLIWEYWGEVRAHLNIWTRLRKLFLQRTRYSSVTLSSDCCKIKCFLHILPPQRNILYRPPPLLGGGRCCAPPTRILWNIFEQVMNIFPANRTRNCVHLQWTEMGPSWPNCSLVLCTWPMKSMKPSPDLGTPWSSSSSLSSSSSSSSLSSSPARASQWTGTAWWCGSGRPGRP